MDDSPQPLPPPPPFVVTARPRHTACWAPDCAAAPLVHWTRRLTDDEAARELALEQWRRDGRILLRDTQLPMPDFGPMPDPAQYTYRVDACGKHAIDQDPAAQVHQAHCAQADPDALPGCRCEPEPLPKRTGFGQPQEMPAHWGTDG